MYTRLRTVLTLSSTPKQLLADAAFAIFSKRCQVDGTTFLGHFITWEPYILALWNAKRNSQGWRIEYNWCLFVCFLSASIS